MAHVFLYFFDEKDDVFALGGIGVGPEDRGECAQVTAYQRTCDAPRDVERIGRKFVFGNGAGEDIPQERA